MNSEIKIDDKISLRIPSLEDAAGIYEAIDNNRGHLKKYLTWVDTTLSVADTEENIKKRIERFETGKAASFIIYHESKPIGSVGFISLDKNNMQGEIGYWLNSSFEGKGIMTQCVKSVVEYGFKTVGLHRIMIKCNAENEKSAGIPKRLGFTLEGTLRDNRFNDGKYCDSLVFGLLSSD